MADMGVARSQEMWIVILALPFIHLTALDKSLTPQFSKAVYHFMGLHHWLPSRTQTAGIAEILSLFEPSLSFPISVQCLRPLGTSLLCYYLHLLDPVVAKHPIFVPFL